MDAPPAHRLRILFVDDEEMILRALARFFEKKLDYELAFATSAAQALALLAAAVSAATPFHVVVADHRMPKMTGAELLSIVKTQYPSIVRVMTTGELTTDGIDTSAQHVIGKPFVAIDLTIIFDAVRDALNS